MSNFLQIGLETQALDKSKIEIDCPKLVITSRLVPDNNPYLLPDEVITNVQTPNIAAPIEYPSALKSILRLTGACRIEHIGDFGPSIASIANPENKHIKAVTKFETYFGRDALMVANDLADRMPKLLHSTIMELAKLQGVNDNPKSEEETGRIIHEFRTANDLVALMLTEAEGIEWPYYGSVDATPLFIKSIARYAKLVSPEILNESFIGKDNRSRTIKEAMDAAIGWLEKRLDSNHENLLEFKKRTGIDNQTWKDSWDAYMHKNGSIANHDQGIASVEVQALAYDALVDTAEINRLYDSTKTDKWAKRLEERATYLKAQLLSQFWAEDERGGYFVLGTDRDQSGKLRQLQVRTSNMGHLFNSKVLYGEEADISEQREMLMRSLHSEEMISISGFRTLSKLEVRFRSGAYHNGEVWPWDTIYIAKGVLNHGYPGLAYDSLKRIWRVVSTTKSFYENVRGGDESEPTINHQIVDIWDETSNRRNRIEQPPQENLAETVSAILSLKYKYLMLRKRYGSDFRARDPAKLALENSILKSFN